MNLKQATADTSAAYTISDAWAALARVHNALLAVDTDFMLFAAAVVGSTYINGFGSDIDIAVWSPTHEDSIEGVERLHDMLAESLGAVLGSEDEVYRISADGWCSMRVPYSGINLLVCISSIAQAWCCASEACKYVVEKTGEPMPKEERIAIHRIIMGI